MAKAGPYKAHISGHSPAERASNINELASIIHVAVSQERKRIEKKKYLKKAYNCLCYWKAFNVKLCAHELFLYLPYMKL